MAKPEPLQGEYHRGEIRDVARHVLPRGAVWGLVDFIPNLDGAPVSKRGGWEYASPALAGAVEVHALIWAPFSGGGQLVAVDDTDDLWKVDSSASATNKGSIGFEPGRPVFFEDLVIIPDANGASAPQKYDGSAAPAALGGTAPAAKFAATHKSRLLLAIGKKVYFSDVLDPTSFDITLGYVTVTNEITGLAVLRSTILVFGEGVTERIRGDVPPPGGDMIRENLFSEGCVDDRSIVSYAGRVLFANQNGVFITDGAELDNLTTLGGEQQLWTETMQGWSKAGGSRIVAGMLAGYLIVSVYNSTSSVQRTFVCDVERRVWHRWSNVSAVAFAEELGGGQETYFAPSNLAHVGSLSSVLTPGAGLEADADGTDVEPVIEFSFYRGKPSSKRFRHLYQGYVLDGATAHLEVAVTTDPNDESYTTLADTLPDTDGAYARARVPWNAAAEGVGVRLTQVGPSATTELYDLEAEVREREGLR